MFTINNKYVYTEIINNSKFIGIIFKINSVEEFNNILDSIKEEYPKAKVLTKTKSK